MKQGFIRIRESPDEYIPIWMVLRKVIEHYSEDSLVMKFGFQVGFKVVLSSLQLHTKIAEYLRKKFRTN